MDYGSQNNENGRSQDYTCLCALPWEGINCQQFFGNRELYSFIIIIYIFFKEITFQYKYVNVSSITNQMRISGHITADLKNKM